MGFRHRVVLGASLYLLVAVTTTRALSIVDRRSALKRAFLSSSTAAAAVAASSPAWFSLAPSAWAYTPDPDPLQESLYLLSRVQEATVLQERYINRKSPPLQKMKLTLRLVDRSYRLLDQVTLVTTYISNNDDLVTATQVGNEAADRLQEAIDFVYGFKQDASAMTVSQKQFVTQALRDTRNLLFDFVTYLPDQAKLVNARRRVEEENKLNLEEFDPDLANDAGIYDPIVLPWKNIS